MIKGKAKVGDIPINTVEIANVKCKQGKGCKKDMKVKRRLNNLGQDNENTSEEKASKKDKIV